MRWDNHISKPGLDGYPRMQVEGKTKKTHVAVWERAYGNKPNGFIIHHKDFNKENYELSNLELIINSDHRKIHAGWIKTNGEWSHKKCCNCKQLLPLSEFKKIGKNASPGPICCDCLPAYAHKAYMKKRYANC